MERLYVLASASPRRKEIMANIGLDFTVITSDCKEVITKTEPSDMVKELAYIKCMDVTDRISHSGVLSVNKGTQIYVIGADTMVFLDGRPMGKPADKEDAVKMIKSLSGRTHQVMTGVCIAKLVYNGEAFVQMSVKSFYEVTDVSVMPMSDNEVAEYIDTLDYKDKAGGYGIQGFFSRYIDRINGDYFNVVGLPACSLYHELCKL